MYKKSIVQDYENVTKLWETATKTDTAINDA